MIADPRMLDAPSFSRQAELAVLGGMVIDPAAVDSAVEMLGADGYALFNEAHRKVYRAIVRIHERGEVADEVTLPRELDRTGDFNNVGGVPFLASLWDASPTAANIRYHLEIVEEHYLRRKLVERIEEARRVALDQEIHARRAMEEAERIVMAPGDAMVARDEMRAIDADLGEYLESLEDGEWGIETGWLDLDDRLRGWRKGKLYVVAARPSMGKSAFCEQAALYAAIEGARRVDFYATEMDREEFHDRAIQIRGRVDMETFRRNMRNNPEAADHAHFHAGLIDLKRSSGRLRLATNVRTVEVIRARSRRNKSREGLDMIVVDHVADMVGPGDEKKMVATIFRELKQVARELDVPVIAAHQLSRSVESDLRKKEGHRPRMSDLREAGEEPADAVMLLYRPEYYFGPTMQGKEGEAVSVEGLAEVIIGKQRGGWRGTVPLFFRKELTRFENYGGSHG